MMTDTGFKDAKGTFISIGNNVRFEGDTYEVSVNPFTQKAVIDNECGQCNLADVHEKCEVLLRVVNYYG